MATNATLTYTGTTKSFKYEDGSYVTTGGKCLTDSVFTRVDGGNVQKDDVMIANYSYMVTDGEMKNLWVNFDDPAEATAVLAQINACFAALSEE